MQFKQIFVSRHAELRVGWRLLLFVVLVAAFTWFCKTFARVVGIGDDFAINALVLGFSLLASYLMTRFVNRKPFGAIGLSLHPHMIREGGMGLLLGFLMMSGVFLVELMSGYAHLSYRGFAALQSTKIVLYSIPYFGVAACLEEVLFRGYFFQTLMQWITFLPATVVMALLFAMGHLLNPHATAFAMINVALAGIWFSFAYMKTRSLWLPFGLHFAWNFSQTTLYGFPTSGIAFGGFRIFDLTQRGPEWITGGAFGPEGGILASLALIVATWYILKSDYLRPPEGIITLDSVEDLLPALEPEVSNPVTQGTGREGQSA